MNTQIFGKLNFLKHISDKALVTLIKDNPTGKSRKLTYLVLIRPIKEGKY